MGERVSDMGTGRVTRPEVSDEAVRRATGRGWDEWVRLIDGRQVESFSHRDTAAWLASEQGLDGWWAQCVTVGYERLRGLRDANQTTSGFRVGVSRTLPLPIERVWAAISDDAAREAWAGAGSLRVRRLNAPRVARFDFTDGRSRVTAGLLAKGDRTTLSIEHERLAGPEAVEPMRTFWRERLTALERHLADDAGGRAGHR